MTLKTVIIEDEAASRANLERLLANIPEVSVEGYASNGVAGLELVEKKTPDLIFLDINLPGYDGFELLAKLKRIPHVIFVTAFNDYAVRAFESNCVDYLLKPVTGDRLRNAVAKIITLGGENEYPIDFETIKKMLNTFKIMKRFPVKMDDEVLVFNEEDVFAFTAESGKSRLLAKDASYDFPYPFETLPERLDGKVFSRISGSVIVNIGNIFRIRGKKIILGDASHSVLKTENGYLPAVKEMWDEMKRYR